MPHHTTLEKLDSPYYTKTVYTPVISSGLEHVLATVPYANSLIEKSIVSPSVIADILYRKPVLGIPLYRQAVDYRMNGIELLKQTIINWVNRLVPKIMGPVCDYLTECLLKYKYTQNDETYIQVNKDDRGPGHKSIMWVHCSSELLDYNPIIIFCFGAKVNAMMYSVVETAKANHVNVRCYLRYLFEEIPKHLDQSDKSFLKDMAPWSDAYRSYESQKSMLMNSFGKGSFLNRSVQEPQGKEIQRFINLQKYIKMTNYQLTAQLDRFRSFPGSNCFGVVVHVQVSKVAKICDF